MAEQRKRRIAAEDLYRLQLIGDCRISPDGEHVVFCVQRVDRTTEKKYVNLWIVATGGGQPRQFTYGNQVDIHPRWSPDGRQIAFLSNRGGEDQFQIYLIPFHGGEARPLTNVQGEFGAFEWSPDGARLVCQFRKRDAESVAREKDEQKKKLGIVARHVTRVFYKLDGSGYLPQERWHIWTVDGRTGRARQLTDGAVHDEVGPCWSPGGQEIAFCSNRCADPDLDPDMIDLFVMPAAGGEPRRIETPPGPKEHLAFSPDGRWLAYLGHEGRGQWWRNTALWIVPVDSSAPARNLTAAFDFTIASATINDLPGASALIPPAWSRAGDRLYFQVTERGDTVLKSVGVDGKDLRTEVSGPGVVGVFGFDAAHTKLACFRADMADVGQVWLREEGKAALRPLTRLNQPLLRGCDLGSVEEVWFKGAAGHDLQGWILKPPGFDETRRYPAILQIHGGPRVQYGNYFMHEFYYLAAGGYIVFFCNPRGGLGYGEAHAKAILNDWGGPDYADLMAWTDVVQQKPYVDAARLGVTGGSYGGYMALWIIGHTDRFRAAVVQRCVSNLLSMYGSSDVNWTIQDELGNEAAWENPENYWRQSPLKYIANVKTPTLIIHSENDMRCAIEQGEQVFVALKRLGVTTEMVRFPEEFHGLSRGGRTDRRIERLRRIRQWFDTYLGSSM